jgi:uncharacterized membrane protein YidH (DUF202 family)
MRTIVGLLLILGGLALGYYGYKKMQDSKEGVKIGNLEISATNDKDQTNAWIMIAGGGVCVIAGAIVMSKKGK